MNGPFSLFHVDRKPRQPGGLDCEQFVGHGGDLIQGADCGGQKIEHHGVLDRLPVVGQRSLNEQFLHIDIGPAQGSTLSRTLVGARQIMLVIGKKAHSRTSLRTFLLPDVIFDLYFLLCRFSFPEAQIHRDSISQAWNSISDFWTQQNTRKDFLRSFSYFP